MGRGAHGNLFSLVPVPSAEYFLRNKFSVATAADLEQKQRLRPQVYEPHQMPRPDWGRGLAAFVNGRVAVPCSEGALGRVPLLSACGGCLQMASYEFHTHLLPGLFFCGLVFLVRPVGANVQARVKAR